MHINVRLRKIPKLGFFMHSHTVLIEHCKGYNENSKYQKTSIMHDWFEGYSNLLLLQKLKATIHTRQEVMCLLYNFFKTFNSEIYFGSIKIG